MKICASSFQCRLSSESLTLHQENPNSWCGIMLMWTRVTGLAESWQSSAIWAAEQQPRAARSCHALPASAAPATPTNFGAFPNLMQWRISMTLKPEIPQFALGWDWECQLFCPPLPKLSHSLLYPVCHSQFPIWSCLAQLAFTKPPEISVQLKNCPVPFKRNKPSTQGNLRYQTSSLVM